MNSDGEEPAVAADVCEMAKILSSKHGVFPSGGVAVLAEKQATRDKVLNHPAQQKGIGGSVEGSRGKASSGEPQGQSKMRERRLLAFRNGFGKVYQG